MTDAVDPLPGLEPPEDPLAKRVAELEANLAQATLLLARLAKQVTGSEDAPAARAVGGGAGDEPARWPWFVLGDIEDDAAFPVWVAWLGSHYVIPETGKSIVYDCWAKHDAVVAELATLWQAWRAAFLDPKASPDAAQNWHDRWLPGFMQRRDTWFHKDCRNGTHRILRDDRQVLAGFDG
jgi:hypothetical protein